MGLLEFILIAIGLVLIFGSFYVPEKLSKKDLDLIANLSEAELRVTVEKKLEEAKSQIEDAAETAVEQVGDAAERRMEKESNEKIMAISEYSDQVLEVIHKSHTEVTFLYSMLNDKYDELTGYVGKLMALKKDLDYSSQQAEWVNEQITMAREEAFVAEEPKILEKEPVLEEEEANVADKEQILAYYKSGMSEVEIARAMGLGIGAVRLVIGLYKGE